MHGLQTAIVSKDHHRCDFSTRVFRSTHLAAFSGLESSMLYVSLDEVASARRLMIWYKLQLDALTQQRF
jgi:hypothetical protein